jgi:hypothetical protein
MKIGDGFIVDVRRDNYVAGRLSGASFLHRPSTGELGNSATFWATIQKRNPTKNDALRKFCNAVKHH